MITLFAFDRTMMPFYKTGNLAYDLFDLVIAVGCFFIAKQNPKSFWYVPIICNAPFIVSSIVKPEVWSSLLWIPIVSGFGVSFLASVIGALVGRWVASRQTHTNGTHNWTPEAPYTWRCPFRYPIGRTRLVQPASLITKVILWNYKIWRLDTPNYRPTERITHNNTTNCYGVDLC